MVNRGETNQTSEMKQMKVPSSLDFPSALPQGTLLEKYELQAVLGQGGGGISYLAWDSQLEREVVLKEHFPLGLCHRDASGADVLPLDADTYARSLDAFCREARLLAGLSNPHVVPVHEIFSACGTAFMVMGYVEGVTFQEWVNHKPSPARLRKVLCRLLAALSYLHGNGVIHRDIKPANIIIRADDNPVLIDFGAAILGVTHTQTLIGSPGYAAPEQFVPGQQPSPQSDIYALGRTVLLASMAAEIKLPGRMRRALEKASEMNPAKRFKSAREWQRRLRFPHMLVWLALSLMLLVIMGGGYVASSAANFMDELGQYAENATAENAPLNPAFLDYYENEEMVYPTLSPLPPVADEYVRKRIAIWDDYLRKRGDLYTETSARIKAGEDYYAAKKEHCKMARKLRKDTDDKLNRIYREYVQQNFEGATFLEKELKALVSPKPHGFKGD